LICFFTFRYSEELGAVASQFFLQHLRQGNSKKKKRVTWQAAVAAGAASSMIRQFCFGGY